MTVYFNVGSATHSLRLRPIDHKDTEVTVYEGLVDGQTYFWFEAWDGIEVWDLIEDAVAAYNEHRVDETITRYWRE